ncbi:hypothetical protein GWI33_017314 [Rhynchophorus ferrugineus]|uniref:Uncharacterized protein n=1 Tax=Rhynchophorus ferrugineus TaxID=354439 RepID=A0A834HZZ9_RHYFE|nr:hypothetical protein GWI33_017314 [Rhynchophorus ferrugineus]
MLKICIVALLLVALTANALPLNNNMFATYDKSTFNQSPQYLCSDEKAHTSDDCYSFCYLSGSSSGQCILTKCICQP